MGQQTVGNNLIYSTAHCIDALVQGQGCAYWHLTIKYIIMGDIKGDGVSILHGHINRISMKD